MRLSGMTRSARDLAVAAALAAAVVGCGSSTTNHTVAGVSTGTTSTTGPTAATGLTGPTGPTGPVSHHSKHPKTKPAKKSAPATKKPTTTTTTTTTHATTTTSSTKKTTTHHQATAKPIGPLPSPFVSGSRGGMRASLHGPNHDPAPNKLWYYSVEATTASGLPLAGTFDTEFVFGGQVVGRENPPTHSLKNGRLTDGVTFPARAEGIPLTFQVVVHTKDGSVTLDWPVKVKK